MTIPALPAIMVAPNGARLGPQDHPSLPVTVERTVSAAIACRDAGADGLHAHIRDDAGKHLLDATRYTELLHALTDSGIDMFVQLTTEAVGQYSPAEQRDLVANLPPVAISVGLREMTADGNDPAIAQFYESVHARRCSLQHILYSPDDVVHLATRIESGHIPESELQCLYVLGGHGVGRHAHPEMLDGFLAMRAERLSGVELDWAVCAFGPAETECLLAAHAAGGKLRIGFENNRINSDGAVAGDNAERVRELVTRLAAVT